MVNFSVSGYCVLVVLMVVDLLELMLLLRYLIVLLCLMVGSGFWVKVVLKV